MSRTTNEEQKMNHKNTSEMREKKTIIKPAALTTRRTNNTKSDNSNNKNYAQTQLIKRVKESKRNMNEDPIRGERQQQQHQQKQRKKPGHALYR